MRDYWHAFLWKRNAGMQDLGTLGGKFSTANGINENGQVVGAAETKSGENRAFIWQHDKGMRDLSTLGGKFIEAMPTNAIGISDEGWIVGIARTNAPMGDDERPFLWRSGSGVEILPERGGAARINRAGQIVGMTELTSGHKRTRGVLWDAKRTVRDLGTLGGDNSAATGVNDNGQVVGAAENEKGDMHAFLWDETKGMRDLGVLGQRTETWAVGLNNDGDVVGFAAQPDSIRFDTERVAFLYTGGQMVDLNTRMDPASGWHLMKASGINDSGQIVGNGKNSAGQFHAFLLTPVP
jgi:probable HAF family extracellular repeat protein